MGKTSHDDDDDDDDDGGMRSDCKPLMGKNLKPLLNWYFGCHRGGQSAAQFLYTMVGNGTQLIIGLKIADAELKKINFVGAPVPHVGNKTNNFGLPHSSNPLCCISLHPHGSIFIALVGWLCWLEPGNKGNWRPHGCHSGILHLWVQAVYPLLSWTMGVPCGMGVLRASTKIGRFAAASAPQHPPT